MTGTSDNGRENGARRVISGETGLAHAGAVVHDQRSYFVVTHVVFSGEAEFIFRELKKTGTTLARHVAPKSGPQFSMDSGAYGVTNDEPRLHWPRTFRMLTMNSEYVQVWSSFKYSVILALSTCSGICEIR